MCLGRSGPGAAFSLLMVRKKVLNVVSTEYCISIVVKEYYPPTPLFVFFTFLRAHPKLHFLAWIASSDGKRNPESGKGKKKWNEKKTSTLFLSNREVYNLERGVGAFCWLRPLCRVAPSEGMCHEHPGLRQRTPGRRRRCRRTDPTSINSQLLLGPPATRLRAIRFQTLRAKRQMSKYRGMETHSNVRYSSSQ